MNTIYYQMILRFFLVKSYLQYFSVFNILQTNYAEIYPDQWQALFHNNVDSSIQYNNEIFDKMLLYNSWICPIITGFNEAFYFFEEKFVSPIKNNLKQNYFFIQY